MGIVVKLPKEYFNRKNPIINTDSDEGFQRLLDKYLAKCYLNRNKLKWDMEKSAPLIQKTLKRFEQPYTRRDGSQTNLKLASFSVMGKDGQETTLTKCYNRGYLAPYREFTE